MTLSIPIPPRELQYFWPFLEYMMLPIMDRLRKLGVPNPVRSVRRILVIQRSTASAEPTYVLCPTKSIENAVEISIIQFVVSQAGWLTWEDFLWLVMVGRDKGPGGSLVLIDLSKNALKLQEEVSFLYENMEDKEIRPFSPVLRKMIQRYLQEVEMRNRYLKAVQKRYRDFDIYGRSLNFGFKDLEEDVANGDLDEVGQK